MFLMSVDDVHWDVCVTLTGDVWNVCYLQITKAGAQGMEYINKHHHWNSVVLQSV